MTASAPPRVAAIIATVHRPEDVVVALKSVLRSTVSDYEVHVIDQSTDELSRERLHVFLDDPRVHYTAHSGGGLSAALNRGASLTDAELLAITGDDCTVRADWLEKMVDAFDSHPNVGVIFGTVSPGPYERDDGFVPGCVLPDTALIEGLDDIHRLSGTTANMGVRRSAWRELHGFDETLGVGAPLRSAEDLDLTLRALARGYHVLQTPEVETMHHSPTLWADRAATIRRNWYGSGAAFAKSLRLERIPMLRALTRLSRRWAGGGSQVAATYGPKPARFSMLAGFAWGFIVGLFWGVDRKTNHFR
jgi:GT2 family glycosyltransferase